jgi:hypothetical protein
MFIRCIILLALLVATDSSPALACSCANYTPIQKTLKKYNDRAVFTAHVVQLIGKTYNFDGKRFSDVALAVVHDRYWGLPWYWPKVVILNGQYPCDTIMAAGEDYLVSGRRARYGVLEVNLCSRTQPLKTAQVDLRTLDGSHCGAPGGTLIGKLYSRPIEQSLELSVYPGEAVTLIDSSGKQYSGITDAEGIFELRHLPVGKYEIEPKMAGSKYNNGGHFQVYEGECMDASLWIHPYVIAGRILGLKPPSTEGVSEKTLVELVPIPGTEKNSSPLVGDVHDDGGFFFEKVPTGEYLLGVNLTVPPTARNPFAPTYFPGTTDQKKATSISVGKQPLPGFFDFAASRVALANVPVVVAFPDGTLVPEWYAELELAWPKDGSWTLISGSGGWSTGWGDLVGIAGRRHRVHVRETIAYGADEGARRCSDPVEVTAKPGTKPIHLVLDHRCKEGE